MNEVAESIFLKRLEEVTKKMPDDEEASSTWITLLETYQATPMIAENMLKDIEENLQESYHDEKEEPQKVNTQGAIEEFLTLKADAGGAKGYIDGLTRRLRLFGRQYPELPTSADQIRTFLRQFKTSDVPTRQDQWMALSMLYKFATTKYGINNPMPTVDKPRFRRKPGPRLSRDQTKLLLSAVNTDVEWALVTCFLGLRFRRIEAERLRLGDIKSDYLIVQGKERTEELPLLSIFRDKLLALSDNKRPDNPLFSIKGDTMAYHIERIFKRAGIDGVRASPHTLRNTAAALWSVFGGDWTSNRQLLRHSAKTMTDHYCPLTIDELREKDYKHNPMLNLMEKLDLTASRDYQNITGGRVKNTPSSTPN